MIQLERGKILKIKADGHEIVIAAIPTAKGISALMDGATLDFVSIGKAYHDDRRDLVMAVRFEMVPTKARYPVNEKATKLYHAICVGGTTHQIVGDVVIVHDGDFPE